MSSPVERAQMSSLSMLAGLMPPPSQGNPLPISWQPIPISHMPKRLDLVCFGIVRCFELGADVSQWQRVCCFFAVDCSRRTVPAVWQNACAADREPSGRTVSRLWGAPPVFESAQWFGEYDLPRQSKSFCKIEFFLFPQRKQNKTVVRLFSTLWDTFLTQYTHNMELPLWAVSVFPDRLRPIVEQGYKLRTHTKFMSLAKAAPLVTRITNQMLAHQNRSSSRLVYIYSGHDLTLLSIMRLLKLENQTATIPEYGATLAFELHCESEDECSRMEFRVSVGHLAAAMGEN